VIGIMAIMIVILVVKWLTGPDRGRARRRPPYYPQWRPGPSMPRQTPDSFYQVARQMAEAKGPDPYSMQMHEVNSQADAVSKLMR